MFDDDDRNLFRVPSHSEENSHNFSSESSTASLHVGQVRRRFEQVFRRFTPGENKSYETTTPQDVLAHHSDRLTDFEREEIINFPTIYYFGENSLYKGTFFDNNGFYHSSLYDHLMYRFEIWDFISKGAFAIVFNVYDHKNKKFVVIKAIRNKRFLFYEASKEIEMLETIKSLNDHDCERLFVKMLEHFDFRGFVFVVFEKLSLDLFEVLKMNSFQGFGPELVRSFAYTLVECVYVLSKHNIVHCDLKPENMLLCKKAGMQIKLIDFGLSCFYSEIEYQSGIQTRYYAAPETNLVSPLTAAVDMWSVGCIIAELISGHPLFKGDDEYDQVTCMMEVLGIPPRHFLNRCDSKNVLKYVNPSGFPTYCQFVEDGFGGILIKPCPSPNGSVRYPPGSKSLREILNNKDNELFDFVSRCLDWDPFTRLTPSVALQHPYLKRRIVHTPTNKLFDYPILITPRRVKNRQQTEPPSDGTRENNKRHFSGVF